VDQVGIKCTAGDIFAAVCFESMVILSADDPRSRRVPICKSSMTYVFSHA